MHPIKLILITIILLSIGVGLNSKQSDKIKINFKRFDGTTLVSCDNGISWKKAEVKQNNRLTYRIFLKRFDNTLLQSYDGGITWVRLTNPVLPSFNSRQQFSINGNLDNSIKAPFRISLFNPFGKLIFEDFIEKGNLSNIVSYLNSKGLAAGLYVLCVEKFGIVKTYKIILNY